MPSAICNNCSELVHWPYGGKIKKQKCKCGSDQLTAVAGIFNEDSWVYYDRKGIVRKIVPRDTPNNNL